MNALIGYFDSPEQAVPTYDPPRGGPCLICYRPLTDDTVRTVSVMGDAESRSGFYRVHRECYDGLTADERGSYDVAVISALKAGRTE